MPNSRECRAHAEISIKEGRRDQDSLWAISGRNKVWFCRSNHAVGILSKKGYHVRCHVEISSTWHPSHALSHHRWSHKWYQQGKERGGLGSTPWGTWSLPQGRGCYEAPHPHSIRCMMARGNRGRRHQFHPQDRKRNAAHLLTKCMKITNWEKHTNLKETEFPWLEEEDISIYFSKLDKEQECLKKKSIKWDDTQKVTQAVDEMYNSSLFDEKQMM